MAGTIGTDTGAFRPALARGLTIVAGFGVVCLLAFLMFGVGRQTPARPVASNDSVQAAHCSQFVELARTKFGPEWKRRLDPRDTACARQIQEAWERQWNPRESPPEPVFQRTMTVSASSPAEMAPWTEAGRAHDPETYCLNVISLAKSKYGPEWTRRIEPAAAASCGVEIQNGISR
jgi:hypothetical protein